MTSRQKRQMQKMFNAQVERERNGAPLDPELESRLTKPKPKEILHQVMVTLKEGGAMKPFGPMMIADAAGMLAEAINKQIALGREKLFAKADAYPMTPISAGVI